MAMSKQPAETLDSYQRLRRLVLALIVVTLIIVLTFGQSMFDGETVVHETIEKAGILMIFFGIFGRLWSTLYIGGRKSATVVTGGPYSITRNPLYLFSTILAAGAGAQMGSFVSMLDAGILCAVAFHVVILREERFLGERLGTDYQAYLKRVPRFFPNFSLYTEGDTGSFKPRLLLNTLRDGLVFLLAMPLFETIEAAQQSGSLPVLFHLP